MLVITEGFLIKKKKKEKETHANSSSVKKKSELLSCGSTDFGSWVILFWRQEEGLALRTVGHLSAAWSLHESSSTSPGMERGEMIMQ